jgi:DNA polymerase-3 subunit delta'
MPLADVIGQDAAVATLKSALVRDAVPQSYLFVGPEGVGKTTTAVELTRALLCLRPAADRDACGACVNCRRVAEGQHPDMARVAPDGEFTRMWQLWSRPGHPPGVLETLPFLPIAGRKRVYLFERADTMNEESANSLLKALEEPPGYVQFVLCAASPSAVLPTILSRCQMVRFRPAPTATIAGWLVQRQGMSVEEARVLAAYAQGAPGRALRLSQTPELREQREGLLSLAERIAHSPSIAAFRLAEELRAAAKPPAVGGGKGKKGAAAAETAPEDAGEEKTARGDLTRALDVLAAWHDDLLSVAIRGAQAPVVHEERRNALVKAASLYRVEQIAENVETLFQFRRYLARNANAQLATEAMMLKLVPRKGAAA